MLKRFITVTLAILLMNLPFAAIASAQAKDDKDAQRERDAQIFVNRLGTNNQFPVKVVLKDEKKSVGGYISQIGDETFVVTNKKTKLATTVEFRNVKKVSKDMGHRYLITGLVVVGVIVGGVMICVAAGGCVE